MSSSPSPEPRHESQHERVAEALRDAPPRMDDLRRARLERRVLARARGAATSQELAPVSVEPARRSIASGRGARVTMGVLALAAAAVVGFVVRGALTPAPSAPRFAIGSPFETREGALAEGARFSLGEGEEGRFEIGDVTAQLRDEGTLEIASVDPDDVRVVLEHGTAELAFHPHARGRQHLRVVTPSADVEVVGTVFTVHVDDAGTRVSVREGVVRVTRRVGEPVLVHAGESVSVPRVATASAGGDVVPTRDEAAGSIAIAEASPLAPEPSLAASASEGLEGTAQVPASLAFRAREHDARVRSPRHDEPEAALVPDTSEASPAAVEAPSAASVEPTSPSSADEPTSDLTAVHARPSGLDSWAAHRPSSREVAAAWHDIDELQARGQFERSLGLLVRLEHYAPASDQDEALFDRARTVQEALRRPRAARALYSEYVRRFPDGRHVQEVRRRLVALGASPDGDPAASPPTAVPAEPAADAPTSTER